MLKDVTSRPFPFFLLVYMQRHTHLCLIAAALLPFVLHCSGGTGTGSGAEPMGEGGSTSSEGNGGASLGGTLGIIFGDFDDDVFDRGGAGGADAGAGDIVGCGDSVLQSGEACDDGNGVSGDGCAANCAALDKDYACPVPGQSCVTTVSCGDGLVTGDELCDDGNQVDGDGCNADCRGVAAGWSCPIAGLRCEASSCGDGIVAGFEECDFATSSLGCTDCRIDAGYDCAADGCLATQCGNGVVERGEQCEDGNDRPFDGCHQCRLEPLCEAGVCQSVCGDGQLFANEACDDGNNRNGDGCSSSCTVESGYACVAEPGAPPASLQLPIVYRDFIGEGNSLRDVNGCYNPISGSPSISKPVPCFHIDFNGLGGDGIQGVVGPVLVDGRPDYVCPGGDCEQNPGHLFVDPGTRPNFNGKAPFAEWYDSSSANNLEILSSLTLTRNSVAGTYVFDAAGNFYPLDGLGWVSPPGAEESLAASDCAHNVSFTSETHFWFEYQGGEKFEFRGDDDLWVFVNGKLVLDLGGLHVSQTASFELDADTDGASADTADGKAHVLSADTGVDTAALDLGLNAGGVYEIALFHAERNECGSNFKVTLKDFNKPKSVCASLCGDGIVASDELCDDGPAGNDGAYGHCGQDCRSRGPSCGDGIPQPAQGEACDQGQNLSGYGDGCAPGCQLPAKCGDSQINAVFGEECDDGVNDGVYAGCTPDCHFAARCGDGQRQDGEGCDDGNLLSGDGCTHRCTLEQVH
jgi:fibro-slime domain-containing protein